MISIKSYFLMLAVCVGKKFDESQRVQIYRGFRKCNLSKEQVKVFANPRLSAVKMSHIRHGLENGLSIEDMKFCARSDLSSYIVSIMVEGIRMGFSREKILAFARNDISDFEAYEIFIEKSNEKR